MDVASLGPGLRVSKLQVGGCLRCSYLRLRLFFQVHWGCWQNSVLRGCRMDIFVLFFRFVFFLLGWDHSQPLRSRPLGSRIWSSQDSSLFSSGPAGERLCLSYLNSQTPSTSDPGLKAVKDEVRLKSQLIRDLNHIFHTERNPAVGTKSRQVSKSRPHSRGGGYAGSPRGGAGILGTSSASCLPQRQYQEPYWLPACGSHVSLWAWGCEHWQRFRRRLLWWAARSPALPPSFHLPPYIVCV